MQVVLTGYIFHCAKILIKTGKVKQRGIIILCKTVLYFINK